MTKTPRVGHKLGKYKLRRRLGSGSFGDVFAAYDTVESVHVALKIPVANDHVTLDDFLREIRISKRLDHSNVLSIKNADYIDDRLTIAYPLGEGSLAERLTKRISLARALEYCEQILAGLAHAHTQRILHRDIKPENMIMFPDNVIKVSDFGAARESLRTRRGTTAGTIGYVAPEQAMGRTSTRSDVFAAGLVLYRLTTGKLPEWPFEWPGIGKDRLRKLSPVWSDFLRRALEVSERKRYADAERMFVAFETIKPEVIRHAARARARRRRAT